MTLYAWIRRDMPLRRGWPTASMAYSFMADCSHWASTLDEKRRCRVEAENGEIGFHKWAPPTTDRRWQSCRWWSVADASRDDDRRGGALGQTKRRQRQACPSRGHVPVATDRRCCITGAMAVMRMEIGRLALTDIQQSPHGYCTWWEAIASATGEANRQDRQELIVRVFLITKARRQWTRNGSGRLEICSDIECWNVDATILRWWRRSVCSGVAWLPAGRDYTATMEQDGVAQGENSRHEWR